MSNSQSGGRHRLGNVGKKAVRSHPRIRAIALALGVVWGSGVAPWSAAALAQGVEAQYSFSIPAGSLHDALDVLATQSGITVVYAPDLVAGKSSRGLSGRHTPADALQQLLKDSGLQAQPAGASSYTLKRVPTRQEPQATARKTAATQAKEPDVKELNIMTVTGSRIRGGTTPSPVITIGSEQMQEEGFSDLGEVIRDIPQNFSGGQNPGIASEANPRAGVSNQNVTGGSAMNLRGLGPDATLTLLNGRRLAYGGLMQAVDISAIPMEAIDRLEIVPDGASALYGSDAVGGVANVILKRDFDGVTVGSRYGGASDGGLITREYTTTAGTTWSTGGLIAAWEKMSYDPIFSDQRSYTRTMYRPSTLWSGNDLHSGLLSLHQFLGDFVELHLDALRSERSIEAYTAYSSVYHRYAPKTNTTLLAPSFELELPNDWVLTFGAALGKDKTLTSQQVVNTATGLLLTTNIGTYSNKSLTYELGAEGRLLTLPGGDARLAIGAGYRYNRFLSQSITGNRTNADGDESSRFAYAELNLPLIGQGQDIAGVDRLVFTGALRTETSGTYGQVTTPKLGLIYAPSSDFTLKASWGKSFKAPTLQQRFWMQNAYLYSPTTFGATGYPADATVLYRSGGNADLKPERARTWSASLAFHPEVLPNLEGELTWFNIHYTDRIVQPVTDTSYALSNPLYTSFVDDAPEQSSIDQAIAGSSNFYNYAGAPYDDSKVTAIIDNRYVNASRQRIKGVDLSGSYRFDVGRSRLTIRGSAGWLDSAQATISTQNAYELSGTLFNPAKLNSRIGAVWYLDGFTVSVFGNYKGGVRNTTNGSKGASFTTFDSTVRYDTGERRDAFANMVFEFSAQNLLNRAPPLYAAISPTYAPYDSTNYSAMGRLLSLSVSKHW